ncbi:uncharacterized protein LOC129304443 isoform X2 [Prosopis cineraria]|uniref:uncharacterized protein LOC129304443 isoform X2 n=1 Tax=Prosopis cineraria TaxID=364024 RepID=UPI0024108D2C|nr:uncharacterized protein LOC129304443 isoform X2 [Prosopis cineraria]
MEDRSVNQDQPDPSTLIVSTSGDDCVTVSPQTAGSSQSTRSRRPKSSTRLRELALSRSRGEKISIQFDNNWKPIGPNGAKFTSFLGLQARSKPSILAPTWDDVLERVKEQIWEAINVTYDVPTSIDFKHRLMTWAYDRWRGFTSLAKRFVHIKVLEGQPWPNPCTQYTFLDAATFEEFVRLRTTPDALKKRRKAQEVGRKNNCPQTKSRGGYVLADKELIDAKRRKREEQAQSDPSILLSLPSPICYDERWIYAHKKKDGSFSSEHAREVAQKIDELKQKQFEGSFIPEGRNDILAIATGKGEHPGRVQGFGLGVSIRDVFGPPQKCHSSRLVTREELDVMLAQSRAEARAEAEAILEARLQKMKEKMMMMMSSIKEPSGPQTHSPACLPSTKGSNIVLLPSEDDPAPEGELCYLYVEDPERRLVAHGYIHEGSKCHFQEVQEDVVKVTVEEETPSSHKVGQKPQLFEPSLWDRFVLMVYSGSFPPWCFKANPDLAGLSNYEIFVENEDLHRILIDTDLTMANIQIRMMFLHQLLVFSSKDKQYGFLCPRYTNDKETTKEAKEAYMNQRLSEGRKECYFFMFLYLAMRIG